MPSIREGQLTPGIRTIGEMLKGAELLAEGHRQRDLLARLDALQEDFGPRILDVDPAAKACQTGIREILFDFQRAGSSLLIGAPVRFF